MNASIKVQQFLELDDIMAMASKLEAEMERVEAGESARLKHVLLELGDVEDALHMLSATIRKFVHVRMFPDIARVAQNSSSKEPGWKKKQPLLQAAIDAACKNDDGYKNINTAIDSLVDEVDIETELVPMLREMGIEAKADRTWAEGFMHFTINDKALTWPINPARKILNKQWNKILSIAARLTNE